MLVLNSNAKVLLSLSFGTTLDPDLGCRDENTQPPNKPRSGVGRETDTIGKFDSAGHTECHGSQGKPGLPANCTEDVIPGLRPEDG